MNLLLVLLAWAASQFLPADLIAGRAGQLSRQWRDFWLAKDTGYPAVSLALIVALPAVTALILVYSAFGTWSHWIGLPFSAAIVLWVLLDRRNPDVRQEWQDAWQLREWPELASPDLIPPETSLILELSKARRVLLASRLAERFSPIFWLLLLGPVAMLAYYLVRIVAELGESHPVGFVACRVHDLSDWLPARVLALTFALAGNFDNTWSLLLGQLRNPVMTTQDLLDGAAQAANPESITDTSTPATALTMALGQVDALATRALIIWVTLLLLHTLWR